MLPTMIPFICQSGFREDFLEINQSETRICKQIGSKSAIFIKDLTRILPTKFQFTTSFGQTASEKRFFRNQPSRYKNCLWRQCLLTDRNSMRNLYKGPSKDVSYQVSVHNFIWPRGFREEEFLEINQSETRIACDGHVC